MKLSKYLKSVRKINDLRIQRTSDPDSDKCHFEVIRGENEILAEFVFHNNKYKLILFKHEEDLLINLDLLQKIASQLKKGHLDL